MFNILFLLVFFGGFIQAAESTSLHNLTRVEVIDVDCWLCDQGENPVNHTCSKNERPQLMGDDSKFKDFDFPPKPKIVATTISSNANMSKKAATLGMPEIAVATTTTSNAKNEQTTSNPADIYMQLIASSINSSGKALSPFEQTVLKELGEKHKERIKEIVDAAQNKFNAIVAGKAIADRYEAVSFNIGLLNYEQRRHVYKKLALIERETGVLNNEQQVFAATSTIIALMLIENKIKKSELNLVPKGLKQDILATQSKMLQSLRS